MSSCRGVFAEGIGTYQIPVNMLVVSRPSAIRHYFAKRMGIDMYDQSHEALWQTTNPHTFIMLLPSTPITNSPADTSPPSTSPQSPGATYSPDTHSPHTSESNYSADPPAAAQASYSPTQAQTSCRDTTCQSAHTGSPSRTPRRSRSSSAHTPTQCRCPPSSHCRTACTSRWRRRFGRCARWCPGTRFSRSRARRRVWVRREPRMHRR